MRTASRFAARKEGRPAAWLTTPIGGLVTRPWFDPVALWTITRAHMPVSRAWAAAGVAEGSLGRFLDEMRFSGLPAGTARFVGRALEQVAQLKRRHEAVAARWNEAFFGPAEIDHATLLAVERARRQASHDYMVGGRLAFAGLKLRVRWPPVHFEIPDRAAVEARYGPLIGDPAAAFRPPAVLPAIERSRTIAGAAGREYWLRFPSPLPAMGDLAWAHVFEPAGIADPPSVVYGHGLGVELESLATVEEKATEFPRFGVRLVRLEAPWHNRRRLPGRYGGEPFLGSQPFGALDLFAAEVREMAMLIAWCRQVGSGRVAVGGTSLGALASQLVASHAKGWPASFRPDMLYAVTTSDDVGGLAFNSTLTRSVGLPQALAKAGWSASDLVRLRPFTDPSPAPPLPPSDMVFVLGRRDTVTPFADGQAMAERWKVAPENLFLQRGGHFTVPLGLLRDPAPLRRLAERLGAG